MKRIGNLVCFVFVITSVVGCTYKDCSTDLPVDYVYVNDSDYHIEAQIGINDLDRNIVQRTMPIDLMPGERDTIVTNKVMPPRFLASRYTVVFSDSVLCTQCICRMHGDHGYSNYLPRFCKAYTKLKDVNSNGHLLYQFTYTNAHYDVMSSCSRQHCCVNKYHIVTDGQGTRVDLEPVECM